MGEKRRTTIEEAQQVGNVIGVDWSTAEAKKKSTAS